MATRSRLATLRIPVAASKARRLRGLMPDAERRMWYYLRAGRFGWKFRRQVPLGPYIADFLCEQARLIVEIDGDSHGTTGQADMARTAWLASRGYRVVRFQNDDVMKNVEGVLTTLAATLATLSPALSQGRGSPLVRASGA